MTIFSKYSVSYSIVIEFSGLVVTNCYVIIGMVFSFQISAVHTHNSHAFFRAAILLSNCRFTDQNLVQPRAPVDDDGACKIRGCDSGVALDSVLGCHAMSLGEEWRRFEGS